MPDINYGEILASGPPPTENVLVVREYLTAELPYVWLDAYLAMLPHQHNVHRIEIDGFEYLWDMSSELVSQGAISESEAVDDRLIAAHGISRPNARHRDDSRLRGRTLGPVEAVDPTQRMKYDRGHVVGHKLTSWAGDWTSISSRRAAQ